MMEQEAKSEETAADENPQFVTVYVNLWRTLPDYHKGGWVNTAKGVHGLYPGNGFFTSEEAAVSTAKEAIAIHIERGDATRENDYIGCATLLLPKQFLESSKMRVMR